MDPLVLPNLFIIGAAKCGTTSLHHYIDQHPSISMSRIKEPNIFSSPDWREQIARFEGLLDASAPIRGESSTTYAKHPAFPGVPARISEVIPSAKLIYVVRDPLRRCEAQWVQNVAAGRETRSLNEALRDFDDSRNGYVWASRYASQIELYLKHFPRQNLLVLDQAALLGDRLATLKQVFGFLGVDDAFYSARFDVLLNTQASRSNLGAVGARLRRSPAMRVYRKIPLRWRPAIERARGLLLPPVHKPALDPGLRAELSALYEEELERLAALTGTRPTLSHGGAELASSA